MSGVRLVQLLGSGGPTGKFNWDLLTPKVLEMLAAGMQPRDIAPRIGVTSGALRFRMHYYRLREMAATVPAYQGKQEKTTLPSGRALYGPSPLPAWHPYAVAVLEGRA